MQLLFLTNLLLPIWNVQEEIERQLKVDLLDAETVIHFSLSSMNWIQGKEENESVRLIPTFTNIVFED